MKYLRLTTTDPYYNLAVEEYLFRHAKEDIFMLWQNEPTVVIGKNQNAYAEVNLSYAKEHGIHVSRRITGGGAVYHDLGNINYSFVTSDTYADSLNYARFCEPILGALADLGLPCVLNGRNDLECGGRKFSGNAQYTADGRILHHGTLLFDTDLSVMSSVLRVDKEKLAYRAVKSTSARVINLSECLEKEFTAERLIGHIESYVATHMDATPMELPTDGSVETLRARNASAEWILSDKRFLTDYTVFRKRKYPYALVLLEMRMKEDRIEDIRISGDFFGSAPIEELEQALIGKALSSLPPLDVSRYIDGMSDEDLCSLLK